MASTYPTALDTWATNKQDDTDASSGSDLGLTTSVGDHATHHNDLADSVNKIETELGTAPSRGFASVAARLNANTINAAEYGLVGDGVTDNSAAIQAAIDATGWPAVRGAVIFPPGDYAMESTVTMDAAGANSTPPLNIIGHGATFTCSEPTPVDPMFEITNSIVSVTFIRFQGCQFYLNADGATGFLLHNAQNCSFQNCLFTASFAKGLVITGISTAIQILGCSFYTMSRGIEVTGTADSLLVQGCSFMEGLSGTPLNWIEINGQSHGVTIVANQFVGSAATVPVIRATLARSALISCNNFFACSQPAIEIGGAGSSDACSVVGNSFYYGAHHDIFLRNSNRCTVTANTFGVRSTDEVPADNTYANIRVIDQFGTNSGSNNSIIGNQSHDPAARLTNVVEVDATCLNNVVTGNSGLAGFSVPHTSNVVYNNTPPTTTTVASASTITIPGDAEYVTISGTTQINTIAASWTGRTVQLAFSGAVLVKKGGTLKIDSDYLTAADDTLTVKFDGTDWREVGRSVESRGMKLPVRAASVGNLTLTAPGATIDGVTMVAGDRFLVKDQTTASQNGLYTWTGAATTATRTLDADTAGKLTDSVLVTVDEGTTNKDSIFTLSTDKPITVGTTALRFTRVHPAYEQSSHPVGSAFQPTSSKLENLPRDTIDLTNQAALTTQIIRVFPAGVLRAADTLSAINLQVGTTASASITNSWGGIARLSDRVVLAVSATSTATTAANTLKTFTFVTPFTADKDETLVGFVMYQATTVPSLFGVNHGNASIITQAPVINGTSNTGQTTPIAVGATMTAFTADTEMVYAFFT